MRKRILLAVVLLFGGLDCAAQTGGVTGEWRGIRTNPAGFVFSATMTLEAGPGCKTCAVMSDGLIKGRIVWTLRKAGSKAPSGQDASTGLTASELVKGEMKGDGLLVLNGYEKDDPNGIIELDQYRLAVSDNGKVIGGITLNGGSWTGQFIAMRFQPMERSAPQ
jgi:hypothetical protein